jgi:hypothetical protein
VYTGQPHHGDRRHARGDAFGIIDVALPSAGFVSPQLWIANPITARIITAATVERPLSEPRQVCKIKGKNPDKHQG